MCIYVYIKFTSVLIILRNMLPLLQLCITVVVTYCTGAGLLKQNVSPPVLYGVARAASVPVADIQLADFQEVVFGKRKLFALSTAGHTEVVK